MNHFACMPRLPGRRSPALRHYLRAGLFTFHAPHLFCCAINDGGRPPLPALYMHACLLARVLHLAYYSCGRLATILF